MRGFSATVGNPPWDVLKPKFDEFFEPYHKGFTKHNRKKKDIISSKITKENTIIHNKWDEYCRGISEQTYYFKEGNEYEYLGKGDINTFKLFLERCYQAITDVGNIGIVVPSALCTDKGCMQLRLLLFENTTIDFMYCYENRNPTVFHAVHPNTKFVVLKIKIGKPSNSFPCAFMKHDPENLPLVHNKPLYMNVKDIRNFSPEVLGIMEFESQRDIDVTSTIYKNKTLLCEKESDWKVKLTREFHMTDDRGLFRSREELLSLNACDLGLDLWLDCNENKTFLASNNHKKDAILNTLVSKMLLFIFLFTKEKYLHIRCRFFSTTILHFCT